VLAQWSLAPGEKIYATSLPYLIILNLNNYKEAHEKHCQTDHILKWQSTMDQLLSRPFSVSIWEKC